MRTGIFCGTGPFYQHRKALSEMQQKTLVGFFTEDLEALEQEAVCTPEFGNGRMFYYYMKEVSSNASAGVGWGIYPGRITEKVVIINYSYLAKNCCFNPDVKG